MIFKIICCGVSAKIQIPSPRKKLFVFKSVKNCLSNLKFSSSLVINIRSKIARSGTFSTWSRSGRGLRGVPVAHLRLDRHERRGLLRPWVRAHQEDAAGGWALLWFRYIALIYNMIIYFRWPSRASTRSPTTSPTISSRSRPSFWDQRLRLMYKKRGRCFKKPFDATLWPVWQRIPQANDNQTSSKRPLQYRSPPHTATRNQILQNTKRTKKQRKTWQDNVWRKY